MKKQTYKHCPRKFLTYFESVFKLRREKPELPKVSMVKQTKEHSFKFWEVRKTRVIFPGKVCVMSVITPFPSSPSSPISLEQIAWASTKLSGGALGTDVFLA